MPDTWISDEMRAAIGREYGAEKKSLPISSSDIRRWAAAIYWPEPPPRLFWDEEYAASTSHGGLVAPEELNPFAWFSAEGPNLPSSFEGVVRSAGPEESLGVKAPETSFIMAGGTEVTYGVRMRPGDVITSGLTKLTGYTERESRLGLTLFTTTSTGWTNQKGETVKTTSTILIRY
jgi:hypothetical protein